MRKLILSCVFCISLVGCGAIENESPELTTAVTWQELILLAERYEDEGKIDEEEEDAIEIAILAHRASEKGLRCFVVSLAEGEAEETCAESPEALALIAIRGLRTLLEEQENE